MESETGDSEHEILGRKIVAVLEPLRHYLCNLNPDNIFQEGRDLFDSVVTPEWKDWIERTEVDLFLASLAHVHRAFHSRTGPLKKGVLDNAQTKLIPDSFLSIVQDCSSLRFADVVTDGMERLSSLEAFQKKMTKKKLHEVLRMSDLLFEVAQANGIDIIADFGSGLGYLTLELTKKYSVIAFESNIDRTTSAKERLKIVDELQSQQLQRSEGMRMNAVDLSKIIHVSEFLTTDNAEKIFEGSTKQMLSTESGISGKEVSYLLTGLHACGDLSGQTMISLFHNQPRIKAMLSVGCCYHLMDAECFPRSICLQGLNFKINKKALKIASHSFGKFDNNRLLSFWKTQTIRALYPKIRGKLQLAPTDSIQDCLQLALQSQEDVAALEPAVDIGTVQLEICLKEIVFLSTLRSVLGPLVEYLVLLDRCIYIRELGYESRLIALFNRDISPRNVAVLATKK